MAGFMIAAPGSGGGKTMITCGLLELLKGKGYNPFAYKCGPDYIDGLFHRRILEVEGSNLDSILRNRITFGKNTDAALKSTFRW